jgi:Ni/Co efflux regulator RcnB
MSDPLFNKSEKMLMVEKNTFQSRQKMQQRQGERIMRQHQVAIRAWERFLLEKPAPAEEYDSDED